MAITKVPTALAIIVIFAIAGLQIQQTTAQTITTLITYHVQDYTTAQPLPGATVALTGFTSFSQIADSNGNVTLAIPPGTFNITVSNSGCTQIGPQVFLVDQATPTSIIAQLHCPLSATQPKESPSLQTDKTQYGYGETVHWSTTGFAPGAYVQVCIANICGPVIQSNASGNALGMLSVDQRIPTGQQITTAKNTVTDASIQVQITISSS
jgi:hypothetical protein